jgi:hypothetical protein
MNPNEWLNLLEDLSMVMPTRPEPDSELIEAMQWDELDTLIAEYEETDWEMDWMEMCEEGEGE